MFLLKFIIGRIWTFLIRPRFFWGMKSPGGFRKNSRVSTTACIFYPERLKLGDHVYIGQFCFIDAQVGVEIGEGCQIGWWTSILNHSSHVAIRLYGKEYVNQKKQMAAYFTKPVKIGAYSFIGPHATVMPGTVLGKGTLVSAYSMVNGEYPDFAILSGNPATQVGDTRDLDARYLRRDPELQKNYDEWVNRL